MKDAESVTFGTSGLERAAHLRRNPPEGDVVPIWRGKPMMEGSETARTLTFLPPNHSVFDDAKEALISVDMTTRMKSG